MANLQFPFMPNVAQPIVGPSPWPHRWAWLLACATFPLVWWGGFVTATGSGMAFRDWLTSDGVLMPFYPWLNSTGEKFIEHGHRLLGMLAGVLTIAVVISTWLVEPRRWVRWYSAALLIGVVLQGVLGGLRVVLDERLLALLHGCTGPLFFAATAAMVGITSPRWRHSPGGHSPAIGGGDYLAGMSQASAAASSLLRLAILTATLAYLQLVLGVVVRHSPLMHAEGAATVFRIAVYFHVLVAFVVSYYILRLAHSCYGRAVCPRLAAGLAALILVQLLLGASTWLVKYGLPAWTFPLVGEVGYANHASGLVPAAVAAGHGAVGALIFALSTAAAVRAAQLAGLGAMRSPMTAGRLQGVVA